jgi:uncharacterized damage-inducible protein DinB
MIASVGAFVRYFEGVRRRTWAAVDQVTPELLAWAPRPGELTCGDLVRHIAGAERFFVEKVVADRWTAALAPGAPRDLAATRALLAAVHEAEMGRLAALPDARLDERLRDLEGRPVEAWRFLLAMVEHEVHHRSQLDTYLTLAGAEPPQLYGYRMDEVIARVGLGDT